MTRVDLARRELRFALEVLAAAEAIEDSRLACEAMTWAERCRRELLTLS